MAGQGVNQVVELHDPVAHAEVVASRTACCIPAASRARCAWRPATGACIPRDVYAGTSHDVADNGAAGLAAPTISARVAAYSLIARVAKSHAQTPTEANLRADLQAAVSTGVLREDVTSLSDHFPVVLLIVAVFVHSLVVSIILGGLAVLLLTVAVIWTVNQRHRAVGAAMSAAESRTTRGTDRRARRARLHADI